MTVMIESFISTVQSNMLIIFFKAPHASRYLHSFPTRRSSDLIYTIGLRDPAYVPSTLSALATAAGDRKSTRLNSSHSKTSYAVFCLKKKITSTFPWNVSYITRQRAWPISRQKRADSACVLRYY